MEKASNKKKYVAVGAFALLVVGILGLGASGRFMKSLTPMIPVAYTVISGKYVEVNPGNITYTGGTVVGFDVTKKVPNEVLLTFNGTSPSLKPEKPTITLAKDFSGTTRVNFVVSQDLMASGTGGFIIMTTESLSALTNTGYSCSGNICLPPGIDMTAGVEKLAISVANAVPPPSPTDFCTATIGDVTYSLDPCGISRDMVKGMGDEEFSFTIRQSAGSGGMAYGVSVYGYGEGLPTYAILGGLSSGGANGNTVIYKHFSDDVLAVGSYSGYLKINITQGTAGKELRLPIKVNMQADTQGLYNPCRAQFGNVVYTLEPCSLTTSMVSGGGNKNFSYTIRSSLTGASYGFSAYGNSTGFPLYSIGGGVGGGAAGNQTINQYFIDAYLKPGSYAGKLAVNVTTNESGAMKKMYFPVNLLVSEPNIPKPDLTISSFSVTGSMLPNTYVLTKAVLTNTGNAIANPAKISFIQTSPTHLGCNSAGQCISMQGGGSNTCTPTGGCGIAGTGNVHLECNAYSQCVSLPGAGANSCSTDANCGGISAPTIPGPGNTCLSGTVLNPGQSCVLSQYMRFTTPGEKALYLAADPQFQIVESNEWNNEAKTAFSILGADLMMQNLTISGSQVVGGQVLVQFDMVNAGKYYAYPANYSYTNQAGGFSSIGPGNTCGGTSYLAPGARCRTSYYFKFSTPGVKSMSVMLDPQYKVPEMNESNNLFSFSLSIK